MPLTPEQQAEVARRYAAGESREKLVKAFSCSSSAVTTAVRRHGGTMRGKGGSTRYVPLLSPEQAELAGRLYEAGASLGVLAAKFNCCRDAARYAVASQGVQIREAGGTWAKKPIKARRPAGRQPVLDAEEAAEAADLYENEGWSRARLEAYFKCSATAITTALVSRGVTMRPRTQASTIANKARIGRQSKRHLVSSVFDLGRHAMKEATA